MSFFYCFIFIVGLSVGSFINVFVYRFPKMLKYSWFVECYEFLKIHPKFNKIPNLEFNLLVPRSHCPNCKQKLLIIDNLPVISYCLLKARCRFCQKPIDFTYPLTEIISAICSLVVAYKYGITLKTLFALIFTWTLICQSRIDLKEYLIPDEVTLPILWLGLIINNFNFFTDLSSGMVGAVLGYLSMWGIYWIFKFITGKEGMGYGDFKFLAMLGAWFGYKSLLLIILISTALGSLVGITLIFWKKHDKNSPLPFGPYLAVAGWVTMLWGDLLLKWYWPCY